MEACRFLLCFSAQFHQCSLRKSVFSVFHFFLQRSVSKLANLSSIPARRRDIYLCHGVYNDSGVLPAFFGLGSGEVFTRSKAVGL
jgi:hypothetical protein